MSNRVDKSLIRSDLRITIEKSLKSILGDLQLLFGYLERLPMQNKQNELPLSRNQ
jgi:hypothetical protein